MTPSELKYQVEQTGSHHFDRKSMKFFGDTMSNYGCFLVTITVKVWYERIHYQLTINLNG